jgi:acyl-ACP thioesterase
MLPYFEKKFEMRYFEMNKFGMASPPAILTLLEETAADHCYDIGYSLYSLEKQNTGWVLISGTIEMLRYPQYKEEIIIRTWLSKFTLVKGHRENMILDKSGNIIGKAKGIWAFYNIKERKPEPIFEEIKLKWGINSETSAEINDKPLIPFNEGDSEMEFGVYKSDIDSNKHVNNIRYFHWLIESLPEEILDNYYLKIINAKFFSEATYGENIQIYIKNDFKNNTFVHTMKNNLSNKLYVVANTQWEKRT